MPTILSHPAAPLALGLALGPQKVSPRLLAASIFCAIMPDFDVIGFKLGINYADNLGHRGATHSLAFAFLVGTLGALVAPLLQAKRLAAFFFLSFAVASHILFDALTSGGLGVAAFWPFSDSRYFLPWRPVLVSPIGIKNLLTNRGFLVVISEVKWVWLPCFALAALLKIMLTLPKSKMKT